MARASIVAVEALYGYNGPFVDGNDNVYLAVLGDVYKSTEPLSSAFSLMDSGNTMNHRACSLVQENTWLHIGGWDATNGRYSYCIFAMSDAASGADTYLLRQQTIEAPNDVGALNAHIHIRSDSDIIFLYNGDMDKVMGTDYNRADYAREEGSGWTVGINVGGDGVEGDYLAVSIGRGASDNMWLGYRSNSSIYYCKKLDSSNTLGSSTQLGPAAASTVWSPLNTYYDDSGVEAMTFAWVDTSTYKGRQVRDGTPYSTSPRTIGTSPSAHCLAQDGVDTYACGYITGTTDMEYALSSDNGSWSSFSTLSSASGSCTSASLNVIDHGGGKVLAVVYWDSVAGNTYYDEVSLGAGTDNLTASNIKTGAPTVTKPTIAQVHALTSNDVATGSPTLTSPSLAQDHTLTASDIATGAPTLSSPTLQEANNLDATSIATSAPTLTSPTLAQTHILTAASIATDGPTLTSPSIAQDHTLTASDIAADAPTLTSPSLAQTHALTAADIVTGPPTLTSPDLDEANMLTASNIATSAPTLTSPSLAQNQTLTATNIATAEPTVTSPSISQVHSLTTADIATASPTFLAPALSETNVLTATDIATGSPTLTSPVISTTHVLTASDIATAAPTFTDPDIAQGHVLAATNIATGVPVLTSPAITQTHSLATTDIATGAPTLTSPILSETNMLVADSIATGAPTLTSPAIDQTHSLTASNIATSGPTVTIPALAQIHDLTANNIATGAPTLTSPTLTETTTSLTADNIATAAPTLTTPTLAQTHSLTATDIATGGPTFTSPALAQDHALTATSIATSGPTLTSPTLTETSTLLTASNIATGAPTLTSPTIAQVHDLTANNIVVGDPTLTSPSLAQDHSLTTTSIATGPPTVTTPTLDQVHVLSAASIATDSPTVTAPTLAQTHALDATDIATGPPTFTSPTLAESSINLDAMDITTGAPVLTSPTLAQVHILSATSIATGAPTFLAPALAQDQSLITSDISTAAPTVSSPILTESPPLLGQLGYSWADAVWNLEGWEAAAWEATPPVDPIRNNVIEARFAGEPLCDAEYIRQQILAMGTGFLDAPQLWDKLKLANGYRMQSGRQSGCGYVILSKESFDKIPTPREFVHTLQIKNGTTIVEIEKLGIIRAQGIFARPKNGLAGLPADQSIPNEHAVLCELGDARTYAQDSYWPGNNNASMIHGGDGEVPSWFLAPVIWEYSLHAIFDSVLLMPFPNDLGATTLSADAYYFTQMSAWDCFWTILDGEGWDFVVGRDGTARVITGEPDDVTEDPDDEPTQMFENAKANHLIDFTAEQLQPSVPDTIIVLVHKRDYTMGRVQQAMMSTPDHSRLDAHSFEFGIGHARSQPNTKMVIWAPFHIDYNENGDPINLLAVQAAATQVKDRYLDKLLLEPEQSDWTFSGPWNFEPGDKWNTVEIYDRGFGWVTHITAREPRQPRDVRWGQINRAEVKTVKPDEDMLPDGTLVLCTVWTDDGETQEKIYAGQKWTDSPITIPAGEKVFAIRIPGRLHWTVIESSSGDHICGYTGVGGVPGRSGSCWGKGSITVYNGVDTGGGTVCEFTTNNDVTVYNVCAGAIDAAVFVICARLNGFWVVILECCPM